MPQSLEVGVGLEPKHLSSAADGAEPAPATVASGNKRPVDQIYRDEASALRTFVKRIVRNSSDAEDLVQETFLRSWPALDSGTVDCPRAFLFRTARNLSLNHIRNGRVRSSDAARAASDEAFRQYLPTAEEQIIASEEAAACHQLLDALPSRCREAFVLRVVDEMSYKQMSKSMRLSVSTVEKHIGKGKQICRSLLTDPNRGGAALDVLASRMPAPQQAARRSAQRALAMAAE
ncbi:MAG: RNA polymerase sigma factor [Proteobacteria bacterium]|nr:RNA polymerase sigma factor [Pseudomonadota bacterium]